MTEIYETDEKDIAILETLQDNSSLSIQQVAKKTGIPMATVHHRLKKLKAEGIISKYTIILDKAKLGKKLVAHILIRATKKADHVAIMERIMKHEAVEDGSVISGPFDVLVKIRVADIEGLDAFVHKFLGVMEDIDRTETMISYRNIVRL